MSNQNYPGHPPEASYQPHMPSGSGSFIQYLHTQGRSGLFLTGIILFTAGTVFSQVASFSAFSIITLLFTALPIIGLWLIFAASKNPTLPEKTLTALTLFKIYIIITLVLISLVLLLSIIAIVFSFILAAEFFNSSPMIAHLLIVPLFITLILTAFVFIYYIAALRILKSIKENIIHNTMNPLRGVLPFSIVAIIMASLSILFSLGGLAFIGAAGSFIDYLTNELMHVISTQQALQYSGIHYEISNIIFDIVPTLTMALLFGILTQVGTILLVVSLNKLAGNINR